MPRQWCQIRLRRSCGIAGCALCYVRDLGNTVGLSAVNLAREISAIMIEFIVNGEECTVEADPSMPLLWALRDLLGLSGTKYGCGVAACGVCTVLVDGSAVRSCVMPVSAVKGKTVTTIEGLGGDHAIQRAWIEEQVPQCGFCQPGQMMQAAALLASNPNPNRKEVREAMSSVLCRCGTYLRIEAAVQRAADSVRNGESKDA